MAYYNNKYLSNIILKAIEENEKDSDYLSNVAMTAAEALKCEHFHEAKKDKLNSDLYREEGNKAYKNLLLQKALIGYNKAMAYAPNGSLALKYAYSNRSAVLLSVKEFEACEIDCKMALAIDCPTPLNLTEKIRKRFTQAHSAHEMHQLMFREEQTIRKFSDKYFKLKSQNVEIPCASADIEVVFESQIPKVRAKNDIAAGNLVALERAFVTWASLDSDQYMSCYYCRKLDLNLYPCGGCVVAMFCSKECEASCMTEYHNVECQIIGILCQLPLQHKWIVKVLIKLRNLCSSWEELITMSHDCGFKRISKKIINEIYDVDNPSSLLCFQNDRHFLHGSLFKASLEVGTFVNILRNLQFFMPQDWKEKIPAIKAIARIMMYMTMYAPTTVLPLVTNVISNNAIRYHTHAHRGLFSFVAKLKHSCIPNLHTVALNSSVALIAAEPIKAGTELTVSQIFHWLENDMSKTQRKLNMWIDRFTICNCLVCSSSSEEWEQIIKKSIISADQEKAVRECFTFEQCLSFGVPLNEYMDQIYKAKTCLNDVPFSAEYEKVYRILKRLQTILIQTKLKNVMLSSDL